jgi:hypothetical protein
MEIADDVAICKRSLTLLSFRCCRCVWEAAFAGRLPRRLGGPLIAASLRWAADNAEIVHQVSAIFDEALDHALAIANAGADFDPFWLLLEPSAALEGLAGPSQAVGDLSLGQ